jgi:selenocysteine lyase/cysteine desulfurase
VSVSIDGVHPRAAAEALAHDGIYAWDGDFYATGLIERLGKAETGGVLRLATTTPPPVGLDHRGAHAHRRLTGLAPDRLAPIIKPRRSIGHTRCASFRPSRLSALHHPARSWLPVQRCHG